jgi:hypothetical protein
LIDQPVTFHKKKQSGELIMVAFPKPPNWPTLPDCLSSNPEAVFYFDKTVEEMDKRVHLIPFDRFMIEMLVFCLINSQQFHGNLANATGDYKAELLDLIEQTELTISTIQAECLLPPSHGTRLVEQWNRVDFFPPSFPSKSVD